MAVGNLGVVRNLIQGFTSHEFVSSVAGQDQGLSFLYEMVERIATRADLTYTNLRVTAPRLFDGTNDVDVESGAGALIAVVAQANTSQLEDAALKIYETNTVVEGTTRDILSLNVNSSSTVPEIAVAVFPTPIPFAALSWSVVDNGADGDGEGTTLGDANGVKVMLVYAE